MKPQTAAALATFMALAIHEAGAQPISVENRTVMSRAEIEKAFEMFRANCSPLNRYWRDIERIRIVVDQEHADHRLALGWRINIHLEVVVPKNPRLIPATDRRAGVLAGHTLHYDIGGGSRPGALGSKLSSQVLCSMPLAERGEQTFRSIPELAFLNYELNQTKPASPSSLREIRPGAPYSDEGWRSREEPTQPTARPVGPAVPRRLVPSYPAIPDDASPMERMRITQEWMRSGSASNPPVRRESNLPRTLNSP